MEEENGVGLSRDKVHAVVAVQLSPRSFNVKTAVETAQESPTEHELVEPRSLFGSFAATIRRSLFTSDVTDDIDDDIDDVSSDVITQSSSQQQLHGDHDYYVVAHRPEEDAALSTNQLTRSSSSVLEEVHTGSNQSTSHADITSSSSSAASWGRRGLQPSEPNHLFQETTPGAVVPRRTASFSLVSASGSCDNARNAANAGTSALTSRSLGIGGFKTRAGFVTISEIAARPRCMTSLVNVTPGDGPDSSFDGADASPSFHHIALGEPPGSTIGHRGVPSVGVGRQPHQRVVEYRLKARQSSIPEKSGVEESAVLSKSFGSASLPTRMRKKRLVKTPSMLRQRSETNTLTYSTLMHRIAMSPESERQQLRQQKLTSATAYVGGCGVHPSIRSSVPSLIERKIIASMSTGSVAKRLATGEVTTQDAIASGSKHHLLSRSSSSSTRGINLEKFQRIHHPLQLSLPTAPPGIPSPFLLQTGLEKALDFAEFQPMSPSSRSSSSPTPSPLRRDKSIITNIGTVADATTRRGKYSTRSEVETLASDPIGGQHRCENGINSCGKSIFDGKLSDGHDEDTADAATVGDDESSTTKTFHLESRLYSSSANDVIYGDVSETLLLTGNMMDIDGCYWDGLQGEEEQIDQWQTTVWNGGCNSDDTPWITPPLLQPEKVSSKADLNHKFPSVAATQSSTSAENAEKRKRRLSCSAKSSVNHASGFGEKRKRSKLACDLKSTESVSSVSQPFFESGKAGSHHETDKALSSDQLRHSNGSVASSSLSKHAKRKRKESSSGSHHGKSTDLITKSDKLMMTSDQPHSDRAAAASFAHETSSSSRHQHRRSSLISPIGTSKLGRSEDEDSADVGLSQSERDEVRADLRMKSDVHVSGLSSALTDSYAPNITRRTKRFASSKCAKLNKRYSVDDKKAEKGSGRCSHEASIYCGSKTADSAAGGEEVRVHGWSNHQQDFCEAQRTIGDNSGDNDAGISCVFDDLLAGWERYLALDETQMIEYELENARHFRYSKGALALVGNRELEVWRIVEQMKCGAQDYLI